MAFRHTVIVVDDNVHFVHHVFRHLTQAFEYGFEPGLANLDLQPRVSPDGVVHVEWHDPRAKAAEDAARSLERFRDRVDTLRRGGASVWALVDVYRVGFPDAQQWRDYAAAFLAVTGDRERLRIVSSYSRHEPPIKLADGKPMQVPVYAKSPETLWSIRKEIRAQAELEPVAPTPTDERRVIHVLITGAGFELPELDAHGLPIAKGHVIGVPTIDRLLERGGAKPTETSGYPIPDDLREDRALAAAAAARDLDQYWKCRLQAVRRRITGDPDSTELLAEQEVAELRERERFREALLQHDVGHLAQALWAAQLDWTLWLSTNYTRFMDRAIAFASRTRLLTRRQWRTIASELECRTLPSTIANAHPARQRWAIKLHGDIGQIQSMALAWPDKDEPTNYAVRPHLVALYELAEKLIMERLEGVGVESTCHWHVVGHALRDKSLTDLIRRVLRRTPNPHLVTVVAPDAVKVVSSALDERRLTTDSRCRVVPLASSAHRYLAALRRYGLPQDDAARETLLGSLRITDWPAT